MGIAIPSAHHAINDKSSQPAYSTACGPVKQTHKHPTPLDLWSDLKHTDLPRHQRSAHLLAVLRPLHAPRRRLGAAQLSLEILLSAGGAAPRPTLSTSGRRRPPNATLSPGRPGGRAPSGRLAPSGGRAPNGRSTPRWSRDHILQV